MAKRKISLRRLFDDYCEIIRWSQPGACPVPECGAPAALGEYGAICLRGHITDEQGYIPPSRSADLALAIVPVTHRDAGTEVPGLAGIVERRYEVVK